MEDYVPAAIVITVGGTWMSDRRRTSKDMHWTLIIFRDSSAPALTFRLPRYIPSLLVGLMFLAILAVPSLWSDYQYWRAQAEQVGPLEATILRQEEAIADLEEQFRGVKLSLEDLGELDRQLRVAIGLDPDDGASADMHSSTPMDQAVVQLYLGAGPESSHVSITSLGQAEREQGPLTVESQLWVLASQVQGYLQSLLDLRGELGAQLAGEGELDAHHRWPVAGGYISSNYGWRVSPITGAWQFHPALDIAAPRGTPIVASAPGTVIFVGRLAYYGETVKIQHSEDIITQYSHCNEITVQIGERVIAGQIIAHVGSTGRATGPHLHWELHHDGEPVNPWPYLPQ